jgi:18S rRNA (guanine1575-N7)-methyltransferase
MSRPELTGHASLFYNERESKKYDSSSRMVSIQREITHRAIELLKLDTTTTDGSGSRPSLILDVGCGSGLSGQVRTNPSTVCIFFTHSRRYNVLV